MYRFLAPAPAGPALYWKSSPGPAPVRIVAGFGHIWGSHFGALPSYKQSVIVCPVSLLVDKLDSEACNKVYMFE